MSIDLKRKEYEAFNYTQSTSCLHIDEVFCRIASIFIRTPSDQLNRAIKLALGLVGRAMHADRSYLFRINADVYTLSNTHVWCEESIDTHRAKMQNFPLEKLFWVMPELQAGRIVNIPDVQLLPDEAKAERDLFEVQAIRSILLVPVIDNNTLIGCMGFDAVATYRIWPAEDTARLHVIAELIKSMWQRLEDHIRIDENKTRLAMVMQVLDGGFFEYDPATNILHISPEIYRTVGFARITEQRSVSLDQLWPWVHPIDLEGLQSAIKQTLNSNKRIRQCFRLMDDNGEYNWCRVNAQLVTHPISGKKHIVGVVDNFRKRIKVQLTKREIEVLNMLPRDLTIREMARELGLSIHTVNNHLRSIYTKLDTQTRLETVLQANTMGLIFLD